VARASGELGPSWRSRSSSSRRRADDPATLTSSGGVEWSGAWSAGTAVTGAGDALRGSGMVREG
jgi:hypothetical protein